MDFLSLISLRLIVQEIYYPVQTSRRVGSHLTSLLGHSLFF